MRPSHLFSSTQAQILDYWELAKPRLVSLVMLSTFVGFFLASPKPMNISLLWATLVGTSLVAAGSMVLNQWMEVDVDSLMRRTKTRPIPSGRVEPIEALAFGLVLSVLGIGVLEATVNTFASCLAALTLLSYLFVYTPLKRKTSYCTLVGALPGALPPMIGWAAARGTIWYWEAWVIFAIIFLWQLPHFFAIAWIYREDYETANLKVLSVTDTEGKAIAAQSLIFSSMLLPVSLLPSLIGMTGILYGAGAFFLGIILIAISLGCFGTIDRFARYLFRASVLYLSLIFILMVVDKT